MIAKIRHIKNKVKELLEKHSHLRDDDNKLLANIWNEQLGAGVSKTITAYEFFKQMADGNMTSSESVRRARQKVQEDNEELRGESYKPRKAKGKEVKQQIHSV